MSRAIFSLVYGLSAQFFQTSRILEISLKRSTLLYRIRQTIYYVSSCIIVKDGDWLRNTPYKRLTICMIPFGVMLYDYIHKNKEH